MISPVHSLNALVAIDQIRQALQLPPQACCADIVAKVRETKAAADLAGAALAAKQATPTQGSSTGL